MAAVVVNVVPLVRREAKAALGRSVATAERAATAEHAAAAATSHVMSADTAAPAVIGPRSAQSAGVIQPI
jgi:hypothetical protein